MLPHENPGFEDISGWTQNDPKINEMWALHAPKMAGFLVQIQDFGLIAVTFGGSKSTKNKLRADNLARFCVIVRRVDKYPLNTRF